MSISPSILSLLSDVLLKNMETIVSNKAISLDSLLKAENIELFKNDTGVVESRAKKIRKDKPIAKAEKAAQDSVANLLVPVDVHVKDKTNALKPFQDAFIHHPSRLKTLDPTKCMGRRTDEKNPIPGTRKGDVGANGLFFPEKQCIKKPHEGKLCETCLNMEKEAKADPTKYVKRWHGRFDEEIFWHAFIVGSKHFLTKYPNGIPLEGTTAPLIAEVSPKEVAPKEVAPKKVPRAKKAKVEPAAIVESVAVSEVEPTVCEWKTMFHSGKALIRNLKNNNVYEADLDFDDYEKMVKRDKFVGQWIDDELDSYAEESKE
jgi:hypothetical protein